MTDVPTKMILGNPPPKAKTDLLTKSSGTSEMGRVCFSLKLAFLYTLGKMTWLHPILPKSLRNMLPVDWNFQMFWAAFKSGGGRIYEDYYIELRQPASYQPKIDEGLLSTYANFKNVTIDKWRAVLARGEDRFGYNKLLAEDADTGVDSLQAQKVASAP